MPDDRAFSAMKCAICFSSASLSRAESVAVDDDAVVVAELLPERGGHDVLQRLQSFAAAPDSTPPSSPSRLMRVPRRLLNARGEVRPMAVTTLCTKSAMSVVNDMASSGVYSQFTTGRADVAAEKSRSKLVVRGTLPVDTTH